MTTDLMKSTTEIRYELQATRLAFERLKRCAALQPETIATHYVKHAVIALNLLKLCEAQRYSDDPKEIDAAITCLVDQIKHSHRYDFGIELEWSGPTITGNESPEAM